MLQCRVPVRPPAPPPDLLPPQDAPTMAFSVADDEPATMAAAPESEPAAAEPEAPAPVPANAWSDAGETMFLSEGAGVAPAVPDAEDPTRTAAIPVVPDAAEEPPPTAVFEVVPEEAPVVAAAEPEPAAFEPPPFEPPPPSTLEEPPRFGEPEPKIAPLPPVPAFFEDETVEAAPPPVAATPPPPAPAPPPPQPPPPAPAASARPVSTPTPRPAGAPAAPRPRPAGPRPATAPRPGAPRPKASAPPIGRYAAIAAGVVVLLGGGLVGWKVLGSRSATPPVTTPATEPVAAPVTAAPAPVETLPAAAQPSPDAAPAATEPTPAPAPSAEEVVTIVKPTPSPKVADAGTPGKLPASPAPAAIKTPPPKPVGPAPSVPSAEQVKAQRLADLISQGEAALAGHQYESASTAFDQAAQIDAQNPKVVAGRASAASALAALKRTFVGGRTTVQSAGKSTKGGVSGFDDSDVSVAKVTDYSGRIEFEPSVKSIKPGDPYTVKIYLVNDGKKPFKIGSVTVNTLVNGSRDAGGGGAPPAAEVAPQKRVLLQDFSGVWRDGINSWTLDVVVTSNHNDTFKSQLAWR
jgi:hypothetical protein